MIQLNKPTVLIILSIIISQTNSEQDTSRQTSNKAILELRKLALAYYSSKYPSTPKFALAIPKYTDKTVNGLIRCVRDWKGLLSIQKLFDSSHFINLNNI